MSISKEDTISLSIQVVSEALKGGIVPLCSIYAQLFLKNVKLENEIKQLRDGRPSDNSWELEKVNNINEQKKFITSKLLKGSSALTSKSYFQAKENDLSAYLSGCRCNSCTYSVFLTKKRKYKIKVKPEDISRSLSNKDNHWALYRGITPCEVLYIGHKKDKSFLSQKKTRRRAIGANIRFQSEDIREHFVSLQDLFFIKASKNKVERSNYPNDSGYGASVAGNLQVDTEIAILNGSSEGPKNNMLKKKISLQSDLQPLLSTHLYANKNIPNIFPREREIFHAVPTNCRLSQTIPSQGRQLEYCDFLEAPRGKMRRRSDLDSEYKSFSHYQNLPRRTSIACCGNLNQSMVSCDSAISLTSADKCRSNQELCQCCLNCALVHDHCGKHKMINHLHPQNCLSLLCVRQNYNIMTHSNCCTRCHCQFY